MKFAAGNWIYLKTRNPTFVQQDALLDISAGYMSLDSKTYSLQNSKPVLEEHLAVKLLSVTWL